MGKLKIGVFGANRGMTMIRQVLNSDEAALVAICDKFEPAIDNCKKAAAEANYEGITYYSSFDEFINHDMDAVILANYANEHVPYAIRLLESGRHVMTECLTCATMKEAVELIEAVERTGKIYTYAENYCYTPVRLEMRKRYRRGDIGELMYAEGEYTHDCSSIWPEITYGDKNHWRNLMPSTFYCTHAIGPILYMTGLRPVSVTSFEAPPPPFLTKLGYTAGAYALTVLTLNNGAIFKSLQFNMKHNRPGNNYQLNGDLGALKDMGDGTLSAYIEEPGKNCEGDQEIYRPAHIFPEAEASGHGGGDYCTTHFFIRSILGDETAKQYAVDVYDAVDMCIPGILGYKSIVNGGIPMEVPNLRDPAARDKFRNDTFCTFPEIAGDQYVSHNRFVPGGVPDEVYEEVRRKWINGERG